MKEKMDNMKLTLKAHINNMIQKMQTLKDIWKLKESKKIASAIVELVNEWGDMNYDITDFLNDWLNTK